jgi:hypothetical protein
MGHASKVLRAAEASRDSMIHFRQVLSLRVSWSVLITFAGAAPRSSRK